MILLHDITLRLNQQHRFLLQTKLKMSKIYIGLNSIVNCGFFFFYLKKCSKYLTYNHEIMFPRRSSVKLSGEFVLLWKALQEGYNLCQSAETSPRLINGLVVFVQASLPGRTAKNIISLFQFLVTLSILLHSISVNT